ncbi:hypothetical protein AAFF_G00345750 [Aldrovandia affinis]|uniref:VLIG-type G domain-containing protein n=1 Tax=Aldrovandia affinis TaxID=143900 RepID=A0AAD7WNR4_9TELE|nr:hypothetical protein AAFF_G00345750 [Aldrovandia affinis]
MSLKSFSLSRKGKRRTPGIWGTRPLAPTDLPWTFLRRLWLLNPQARSPRLHNEADPLANTPGEGAPLGLGEDSHCAVNALDLVTAVYVSASGFLRQEMTVRMAQCGFAVPLLLPPGGPNGQATLLLWPLRAVVRAWRPHSLEEAGGFIEGDIASSQMPLLSFVRLGRCSVSKSQVLNRVLSGLQGPGGCFLHRGMDGGQLPRRLSDGLVEASWYLPSGDHDLDVFPEPVMVANLRGDVATGTYEKQLSFLCLNSSALFVFCGSLGDRERLLLASWRSSASHVFLIMCLQGEEETAEEREEQEKGAALQKLAEDLELPEGAVLSWSRHDGEKVLVSRLSEAMTQLLGDNLRLVTMVEAADIAHELSIAVDEGEVCRRALTQVEEVLKGMEEQGVCRYKEEQLPLQGQLWRRLVRLEKLECRLKDSEGASLEDQKQQLLREKENLCQEKIEYRMTTAMMVFIAALLTPDKLERGFFLSWMRLRLNAMFRQRPDFSLGLEHFTREMGLIFELSNLSPGSNSDGMLCLPAVAADLLLDGLPLELLDGAASTIPLQWVGSVMSEVDRRLPQDSRLRVLTVLGLHTSRNAAVLSALLGVTFPVGCSQHVRGAFMLLLGVPENLRKDLACNYLLLINTEGLMGPGTVQEEDSEMHDNELATLVTGLSNVTIVNLPAEGEVEMQDTLRIVVNALLRVKETGRMPVCQVIAQGNGLDTKLLLSQLGQVTQILAARENNLAAPGFGSLQVYEASSKQCLQGPWQNTHPMAPVSHEYSEVVIDLKQSLLDTLRKCATNTPSTNLMGFMERVRSLWETVLFEKFPFELKNMEVGEAFYDFCTEFFHWEQASLGHMESWVGGVDERILAFKGAPAEMGDGNKHESLEDLLSVLKTEAAAEVESEAEKVLSRLEECFSKVNGYSSWMENYRANFTSSVGALKEQMAREVTAKMETAMERLGTAAKTRDFHAELELAKSVRLQSILEQHKVSEALLEDKQLEEEFDQVWSETVSKLDLKPLETQDIASQVIQQLRENLSNRHIRKHLEKLPDVATSEVSMFKVDEEHFGYRSRLKQMFTEENRTLAQGLADKIIEECNKYVLRKKLLKTDYLDSYTKELLEIVDRAFVSKGFDIRSRFEVELKVHVCASAARSFQEMHQSFTKERDPLTRLEETRDPHFWEFLYEYRKRDQCRKAARAFTALCLKPTALDYIYGPLGSLIQEQMLSGDGGERYRSPRAFHFELLRELLMEDSFKSFLEYLLSHESYIRRRIQDCMLAHLSGMGALEGWRQQRLGQIWERMETAVRQGGAGWSGPRRDVRLLLERVCNNLEGPGEVTIRRDALQGPLFHVITQGDKFVKYLEESMAEMLRSLEQEFSQARDGTNAIADALQALPIKPQDQLYLRVRGCEERCPFCKAPCEAVEGEHTVHRALMHRPKGLVSYTCTISTCLSHTTCSSDITGKNLFKNRDTDGQSLHYRDYRSVYPNWSIPAEAPGNHGTSVYWMYVLVRHNNRFAQEYQCEPAQLPAEWVSITQREAIQSLKEAFDIE